MTERSDTNFSECDRHGRLRPFGTRNSPMSNKTKLGLMLTAVAAVTTGCPDDNPAPRPDVVDVTDSDVAIDTPDADVPDDISTDLGDVPTDDGSMPAVCGDTRFIRPAPRWWGGVCWCPGRA